MPVVNMGFLDSLGNRSSRDSRHNPDSLDCLDCLDSLPFHCSSPLKILSGDSGFLLRVLAEKSSKTTSLRFLAMTRV
jgi:hypothetical protein